MKCDEKDQEDDAKDGGTVEVENIRPYCSFSYPQILPVFKMAFDTNGIHDGDNMCLFQYFVKKKMTNNLKERRSCTKKEKGNQLKTYPEVV